ncbi:MAG: response regulator transcription factor [Bacteroidota bacterium]
MKTNTKVLLVDDHQVVLDGLEAFLHPHFDIVGQAKNGREAIRAVRILQPELVLMDIDMPVMNGMVAAQELRRDFPALKIIMLSLHFEQSIIRHLLQIGVDGYLVKDSDKAEVIFAIQSVAGGKRYFSSAVTIALNSPNDGSAVASTNESPSAQLSTLTEREIEVLRAIAEGYSSREIGQRLYISARTVDTHRNNIMKKLGVNKVVGLIKFAILHGLVE